MDGDTRGVVFSSTELDMCGLALSEESLGVLVSSRISLIFPPPSTLRESTVFQHRRWSGWHGTYRLAVDFGVR